MAPRGAVTLMVPVGTLQVGDAVTVAVGAAGVTGAALIVIGTASETQELEVLRAVKL